jgi:alpha-tubulin suppressor-like RCC1 family protein
MPVVTTVSGVQYSGSWSLGSVANARALGTWPVQPVPYLYSWGNNSSGQLGLGNRTNYSSPKQLGALTDWLTITGGYIYAIAIKTDGTLWAWGGNSAGHLGLGNTTSYSSPKQVGSLTGWLSIASGYTHNLAIKTNGTLWSWGANNAGQLGLGNTTNYSSPKQIGALTTWASLGSNQYSSLAIKTDGTLWSWGSNTYGNLGLGNTTKYSSPKQVGSLTDWLKVAASVSGYTTLAIKTNGTLWAWGQNNVGQVGNNATSTINSPVQIGALTTWSQLSSQQQSSLVIKTDGTLWAWGINYYGNLGLNNATYAYSSPKQVGSLTTWSSIKAGRNNALALQSNGTLWSWGYNDAGQLGQGNTTTLSSPKQIGALTTWTTIGNGTNLSFGIAII